MYPSLVLCVTAEIHAHYPCYLVLTSLQSRQMAGDWRVGNASLNRVEVSNASLNGVVVCSWQYLPGKFIRLPRNFICVSGPSLSIKWTVGIGFPAEHHLFST